MDFEKLKDFLKDRLVGNPRVKNKNERKTEKIKINKENFKKFETLWAGLNHQARIAYAIDSESLIEEIVKKINASFNVSSKSVSVTMHKKVETMGNNATTKPLERESACVWSLHEFISALSNKVKLSFKSVAKVLENIDENKFNEIKKNEQEGLKRLEELFLEIIYQNIEDKISYQMRETTIKNRKNDAFYDEKGEIREFLDGSLGADKYEIKNSSVREKCLFGVDINPNSCEITKLRLWIELLKYSYYIFEEGKNTNNLETLPNIDINIKCANSLISRFNLNDDLKKIPNIKKKIQEYKDLVAQYKDPNPLYPLNKQDLINKIQDLKNTFSLTLKDPKTKAELEKAIEKHITNYNDFALDDKSLLTGLNYFIPSLFGTPKLSPKEEEEAFASYGRIRALRKKLDDALSGGEYHNAFEWRFEFPEVLDDEGEFLGFDCIIGNPPYIKEGGNKELFASTKRLRTYQGKMDIWYHFVGIGLEILKQNRDLSFIATNNWTTNAGAEKLRNILLRETQFISLIDFGDYKVFESADIQTMIMCFKKIISPNQYFFDYRKIIAKKPSDTNRITLLQRKECEGNLYLNAKIEKKNLINKTLVFSYFDSIFNTILKNTILFLNKKEITNGIHPHYDRINKKINEKFSNQFFNGEGIFVLSEVEKNNLKLSQKELKLLKPSYETAEIMKYLTLLQNQHWIIYTDSSFKNPKSMDDYPNLKKHLDRFKEVITSDNKPYGLHRARDERFFTGSPRIIVLRKCAKEPIFSYVDFDCYVSAAFYIIKTKRFDSKFLVGLLNSLLIRFWLKHRGKMQGNNYQIDKEPLMNIPLIKITKSNKPTVDKIIVLVDKILQAKAKDPKANTQELEKEIDALVYQLYHLTDEEIKTIEDGQ
ncbi:type IIS restriction-modification protein [Helicobacter pylori Hp H-44]|nr:type IIS restriction-modification protein [Helicobacter pylori Hp H-44]